MFGLLKNRDRGFTLLEVLLVVAAIGILAGIVILALNPARQLAQTRNAQRWSHVNTLLNAVYDYSISNDGTFPPGVPTAASCDTEANEICTDNGSCTGIVDISVLTDNQIYLVGIPEDPNASTINGTGYYIARSTNGRLTVCAPNAEQGEVIEVAR
jgi:type IV pilus assembly protein PilA